MNTPKVSVSVICYNQRDYIGDCLKSVLAQKVDFPIEIIVGDDASDDGTQAIIVAFQQQYPGIVRPILRQKNVGATENYNEVIRMCTGEYIAHLDGDDEMLPGKLAKQVTFLEVHPECSLVTHISNVVRAADGKFLGKLPQRAHPTISDINYLVENYQFFVRSSAMYRRSANRFPPRTVPTIDMLLNVEYASVGKIGFMNEILGIYRKVPGSGSDVRSPSFHKTVQAALDAYRRALELGVPRDVVSRGLAKFKAGISVCYLEIGDDRLFRKYIDESIERGVWVNLRHRLLYALKDFPGTARSLHRLQKNLRSFRSWLLG